MRVGERPAPSGVLQAGHVDDEAIAHLALLSLFSSLHVKGRRRAGSGGGAAGTAAERVATAVVPPQKK